LLTFGYRSVVGRAIHITYVSDFIQEKVQHESKEKEKQKKCKEDVSRRRKKLFYSEHIYNV
jgi:hypothetical protein